MYGVIGTLVLILDVAVIVDCLQSPMSAAEKCLWIFLVLFLPVLGMLLYFLLAKRPIL